VKAEENPEEEDNLKIGENRRDSDNFETIQIEQEKPKIEVESNIV